jgi:hypothetical protein
MIRFLPVVVELFLLVFCLIDCIQTPDHEVRNLPKLGWVLLIIILPLIGGIAWLVAGRPQHQSRGRQVPWPSTRTAGFPEYERPRAAVAPDDDPEFLAEMRRGNAEQEDLLRKWEDDLRRRERELGKDPPTDDGPAGSTP